MAPEETSASYNFAKAMTEQLESSRVDALMRGCKPDGSAMTSHEAFTAGYTVGCYDTYDGVATRMHNMTTTLKAVYDKLTAASAKYDDVDMLKDLNEMVSVVAGYLVQEADSVLLATLNKLVSHSGVPADYINGTVGYGSIPASSFIEIGKVVAAANPNQFGIFAVSGGVLGPNDTLMTFEEFKQGVLDGKFVAEMPEDDKIKVYLELYGQRQVRVATKMYRDLKESCDTFRAQHEKSASAVAADFLSRLQTQK